MNPEFHWGHRFSPFTCAMESAGLSIANGLRTHGGRSEVLCHGSGGLPESLAATAECLRTLEHPTQDPWKGRVTYLLKIQRTMILRKENVCVMVACFSQNRISHHLV